MYVTKPYNLFTGNHSVIMNLSFLVLDQEMATELPYNWFPGLIFGAFCAYFRAGPVGAGRGAKFGWKLTENGRNLNYNFDFLVWLLLIFVVGFGVAPPGADPGPVRLAATASRGGAPWRPSCI